MVEFWQWQCENSPHLLGKWPHSNPSSLSAVTSGSYFHRLRRWRHCWRFRRRKYFKKCHCFPLEYLDLTDSDTDSNIVPQWSKDNHICALSQFNIFPCPQDRYCVSDSEPTVMPGGFENSSLKNSFSLSSLPPSTQCLESPEHARLRERPYNSLTKKPRRDLERETWRHSWGSKDESKLSAAFDTNYQYLMDNKLIESCKEEFLDPLAVALPAEEWTYEQFSKSFHQLDSWLNSILESFNSQEVNNLVKKDLILNQIDEFKSKDFRRAEFNDQGERLAKIYPYLQNEILYRITHIGRKWDQVKNTVAIKSLDSSCSFSDIGSKKDADREFKVIKTWIKEMHMRLTRIKYDQMSIQELDRKAADLKELQSDIEAKGRTVRALVKQRQTQSSVRSAASVGDGVDENEKTQAHPQIRRDRYYNFEKRWLNFVLFVIECQCRIEQRQQVLAKQKQISSAGSSECSDDEPLSKQCRLSSNSGHASSLPLPTPLSDSQQSVKPRKSNILFEHVDASLMDFSSHGESVNTSPATNFPDPQNCSNLSFQMMNAICSGGTIVNGSKESPNVGYYVYEHHGSDSNGENETSKGDSEHLTDTPDKGAEKDGRKSSDNFSEEEWTYTANEQSGSSSETVTSIHLHKSVESVLNQTSTKPAIKLKIDEKKTKKLIEKVDKLIQKHVSPSKSHNSARSAKISHSSMNSWLSQCRNDDSIQDSCDASGECTTDDDLYNRRSSADLSFSSQFDDSTPTYEAAAPSFPEEYVKETQQSKENLPCPTGVWPSRVPSFPHSLVSPKNNLVQQQRFLSPYSKSESALNKISCTSNTSVRNQINTSLNLNLSSSTVEEFNRHNNVDSGSSSSSQKKKKFRFRKRTSNDLGRKSISGSVDSISSLTHTESTLSLSASTLRYVLKSESSYEGPPPSSGSEADNETSNRKKSRKKLNSPKFAVGKSVTPRNIKTSTNLLTLLNPDEPNSSLSETATWDSYQDKYASETYSEEPPDLEASKRLLEDDDDYRKYIDSQSDASSFGYRPSLNFSRKGNFVEESSALDSDSDYEDNIHSLIQEFQSRYNELDRNFNNQLVRTQLRETSFNDWGDLIQFCNSDIQRLKDLLGRDNKYRLSARRTESVKGKNFFFK